MPALLNLSDHAIGLEDTYGFFEDFHDFVSGDLFTDTSADSTAAVANVDAVGGRVTLTTGAIDNNECYLLTTKELFLFANDKPIVVECRLQYAEANTDDANVAFGLMNAVAANSIIDDAGGLVASYSGAAFYKIDGGTNWIVETSIATTRTGNTTLTAANSADGVAKTAGGSSFQVLRIECIPFSSTQQLVHFYIDGVRVKTITQTYTSATEMMVFVGVKAGGANSEVVTVDYIQAWQKR